MTSPTPVRLADLLCGRCQLDVVERTGWTSKFAGVAQGDFSHCAACASKVEAAVEQRGVLQVDTAIQGMAPEQVRENTALHEAAHAVVGTKLGIGVVDVSMESRSSSMGGVDVDANAAVTYDHAALASAAAADLGAVSMAGIEAERHWLELHNLDTPENLVTISPHGMGDALDLQSAITSDNYARFAAEVRQAASRMVRGEWDTITTVADQLLKHGHVSGEWVAQQANAAPTSGHDDSTAPAPAPDAAPRNTTASSPTPPAGGTAMSGVEDIRTAISSVNATGEQMLGALAQVQQWAEESTAQLYPVLSGSDQPEVEQGNTAFTQVSQQVTELTGLVTGAMSVLLDYQSRL